uniref:Uncharacterized protein n=1 Tax=Oryza punctata TaxID=4537 RepID=A0A0E0LVF6_ORYPU
MGRKNQDSDQAIGLTSGSVGGRGGAASAVVAVRKERLGTNWIYRESHPRHVGLGRVGSLRGVWLDRPIWQAWNYDDNATVIFNTDFITPKKKLVKLPSGSNASKVTGPKAGPDQIDDTLEHQEEGVAEEDMQDKFTEHSVSQRLPLIIPDKVQRSKALIECDGDSIDLSGDVGAVGRIVISNSPNGNQDLLLDLKGSNKLPQAII